MIDTPNTWYLNADFDLSLRSRPVQLGNLRMVRQVRELSTQALLGTTTRDNALLRVDVPQEFLRSLEDSGVPLPRILRYPQIDPSARLRPFGWNGDASNLNDLHDHPEQPPSLATIKQVNGRALSCMLERELDLDVPDGLLAEHAHQIEQFLDAAEPASQWLLKADHGNAGLANRRLRSPSLDDADRRFIAACFAEDDRLLIERWLPRERDWSAVFGVPFDDELFRIHEMICSADGALIGALFDPAGSAACPWENELELVCTFLANRLHAEGYDGPACIDAFDWHDGRRLRLRAVADLNCRRTMSEGAYRLWRWLAPERTLLYRFFNRRKLSLPDSLDELLFALGGRRFDPRRSYGVLPVSPLRVRFDDAWHPPGKLAVIFVDRDRDAVLALEQWFRERFEG